MRALRVRPWHVALLSAALAGCGGSANEEPGVRAALSSFAAAVRGHDAQALCDRVLAPQLVERIESVGLPCEVAVRGFASARRPKLTVQRISIEGSRASARVRTTAANQAPSVDTVALVKIGARWRIASLGR